MTKKEILEQKNKHLLKKNGLNDLLETSFEFMMLAERKEFLSKSNGNKGNGYRLGHSYGDGQRLEFRIPRDRLGLFTPKLLDELREKREKCNELVGLLYVNGLTLVQIAKLVKFLYGTLYKKSSISRMLQDVRKRVDKWRERKLEPYYPIVFVDCIHLKVRVDNTVACEAFYVVLGVTPERTREVIYIGNMPTESATGWGVVLDQLKDRGVEGIGLLVADGIPGLDTAVEEKFPGTPLQRCVVHLKRHIRMKVRREDQPAISADLGDIFRIGQPNYTIEMAWQKWQNMCDRWGDKYRFIRRMRNKLGYKAYMTYLNYDPQIQSMIYTTNWIERLNRDFRRVTRMRAPLPNPAAALTLMGGVAMDREAFDKVLPDLLMYKTLFPNGGSPET